MKTIGVVTVSRSDYGIYLPILQKMADDPELHLGLLVGGTHLSPKFGLTLREIEKDGFSIEAKVETPLSSDHPEDISKAIGRGITAFASIYSYFHPDILLVLGDRYEMFSAVSAALPFKIPVAHIHGGESTEGLIDEALRHSITKMSHLHFVSTESYAQRVIQMGEEPWRVSVSGAPGLDHLNQMQIIPRRELEKQYGFDLTPPVLLVTYHPVTLEYEDMEKQLGELLSALNEIDSGIIFTYPNADTKNQSVIDWIEKFRTQRQRTWIVPNFGTRAYLSVMNYVSAMVGNSSSGIIEAASFKLPVVNVGNRQRGRTSSKNVLHIGDDRSEIKMGIYKALSPEFRASLVGLINPYGDGHASERIVRKLKDIAIDDKLLLKHFYEIPNLYHADRIYRHG